MATATTMKQWAVMGTQKGFDELKFETVKVPQVGENEVLVKLGAASLNYRDLIIPKGTYPFATKTPVAACSDGAGEVVAVGAKVSQWKKGDKVVTLFNQGHQFGPMNSRIMKTGLGGVLDGTLREYGVFNENGLVRQPANLNAVEAGTLTCAGLTAWNAFYGLRPLKTGETVLVLGSGGVSLFALQFAKAAGARVIATTSSPEKADKMKKLGADHVLNYKTDPNWGETARKLTPGGEGADHVIEVGGEATLGQSLKATKHEGIISIIGMVGSGKSGEVPQIMDALPNVVIFRGVYVGSKQQMEEMVEAIEANDIHPVLDEVFPFEKAKDAYQYQWDKKHFGKVAIKIH